MLFNQQTGELTSALAAKDAGRFWRRIYECLAMLVVAVPIYALYYFVRDKLGIYWRRWLTRRFLRPLFQQPGLLRAEFGRRKSITPTSVLPKTSAPSRRSRFISCWLFWGR